MDIGSRRPEWILIMLICVRCDSEKKIRKIRKGADCETTLGATVYLQQVTGLGLAHL